MPTEVTLQGKVLLPNGSGPKSGTITLAFTKNANDGTNKLLGSGIIQVPDGGDFTTANPPAVIYATADLSPGTVQYLAAFDLVDSDGNIHAYPETWEVPASSPQNIGALVV